MRFHITDTFDFLRRVPQPCAFVMQKVEACQAKVIVSSAKTHFAHFSDGVNARAAERALGIRLYPNSQQAVDVGCGDRVLIVGTAKSEWAPDADTQTVCNEFLLLQVAA